MTTIYLYTKQFDIMMMLQHPSCTEDFVKQTILFVGFVPLGLMMTFLALC